MTRIKISGQPWLKIHAMTGDRVLCDVHILTRDGRYFVKELIELHNPRRWCEQVARTGSIDPQHWTFEGRDETPVGHRFVDLADHAERQGAGY